MEKETLFDVVSIGSATEDLFFFSKRFKVEDRDLFLPWAEKFLVEGMERRLGGGAFNASIAFSRLGLKTAFFGRVGKDRAGLAVKEFLEKEKVSSDLLAVDPSVKTATSALLSKNGERTIIMYRGENDNLLEAAPPWEKIFGSNWIFLSDLAGTNHDFLLETAKRAKEREVRLSYVPGQSGLELGTRGLAPVFKQADILTLNFSEAQLLLGKSWSIREMLAEFKKLGIGLPVITQDVEGSFAYDGEEFYHQEVTPKVSVADRTGAGDAFSATFTSGIILGKAVPEALLMAAKNASSVITQTGGTEGLLSVEELIP
jgi:sugar/nucleoside kinase (ribokinase family)